MQGVGGDMDWLNHNGVGVQALSTVVLVVITAWSTLRTQQMAATAKKQLDEAKQSRAFEIQGHRAALIALIDQLVAVIRHFPTGNDLSPEQFARAAQATTGELRDLIELVARVAPDRLDDATKATQYFYWFAALARNGGVARDGSVDRGSFPREEFARLSGEAAEHLFRIHRHLLGRPLDGSEPTDLS